jgi:hypothetical protein
MRKQLCLAIAIIVSVSAYGQYKLVDGKVVQINPRDWTTFHDPIEITGFDGGRLLCRSFTEQDVTVGERALPGNKPMRGRVPITEAVVKRKKTYKESFSLANYPGAGSLHVGDVIRRPVLAMRLSTTSPYGAVCYDCGVDYVPPQQQLAPQQAAATQPTMNNANAEKEAVKLKFDQEQADKGKDLYQYRMGLRYLNGNGVTNDVAKAREYFIKAAAQGNEDATAELRKLPSQ